MSERKEALMAKIQEIDRQMLRVQDQFGIPAREGDALGSVTVSGMPANLRKRSARGALKEKIVNILRAAGKRGATIGEISKKSKVPKANLYVWFNGTGKSVPRIKKIGVAKYRLR